MVLFWKLSHTRKTLHGGLILSVTDSLGSLAVATKGNFMTGVSVDIGTSFVRSGGTTGDELLVKAELISMGWSVFMTSPEIDNCLFQARLLHTHGWNSSTRSRIWSPMAVCTEIFSDSSVHSATDHTKFIGRALDHPVSSRHASCIDGINSLRRKTSPSPLTERIFCRAQLMRSISPDNSNIRRNLKTPA